VALGARGQREELVGTRFTQRSATPLNGCPAASNASRTPRATMFSAPLDSWPSPSPCTVTVTPSASRASTSL